MIDALRAFAASALIALALAAPGAWAQTIKDRIASGQPLRVGLSQVAPFGFMSESGEGSGFTYVHTAGVLDEMGIDDYEAVLVEEWGDLILQLNAGRIDMISGGMYILATRCEKIIFSEPMGVFGDVLMVERGNPSGVRSYADLREKNLKYVTVRGFNNAEDARRDGVPDRNIILVDEQDDIADVILEGRAVAGGVAELNGRTLVAKSGGKFELTEIAAMPRWTLSYVGIGFRETDAAFRDEFNEAQRRYLGTDAMLSAVRPFGYTREQLPDPSVTTEQVCAGR